MTPKLYQYAACPFCGKVRALLQYKGIDCETVEVHPLNKKEIAFSKDYDAVPIYVDSKGRQVNDSTPIMRWIDEEFPERKVFRAGKESEKEEKWLAWSDRFVGGLPAVIYDTFFNSVKSFDYITKVGKFSWFEKRVIKYSGALIMTLVAKKIKEREQIGDPDAFMKQKVDEWAEGLAGQPFMGGETPNAADLAVFGIAQSVAGLSAGRAFRENPAFDVWMKKLRETLICEKQIA